MHPIKLTMQNTNEKLESFQETNVIELHEGQLEIKQQKVQVLTNNNSNIIQNFLREESMQIEIERLQNESTIVEREKRFNMD